MFISKSQQLSKTIRKQGLEQPKSPVQYFPIKFGEFISWNFAESFFIMVKLLDLQTITTASLHSAVMQNINCNF